MTTTTPETAPHQRIANPNGRPPFQPTETLRKQVELLAGLGLAHHKIARILCISPTTLRKHFRDPLQLGTAQAQLNILSSLYDLATKHRNTSAAIFFAKTRCGFCTNRGTEPPNRVKNPSSRNAKKGGF